jgi:hypothetical protein
MAEVKVSVEDRNVDVTIEEKDIIILSSESGPQGPRGTQVLSGSINPSPTIGLVGDQYINTDTGYLFGPKTESGWGLGVPLGANDPNDLGQVHYQTITSSTWNISHTLSFIPNIIIVDFQKNVIEGDYNYVDAHHITAVFSTPITGTAYLS